jgi:hypothetical protein
MKEKELDAKSQLMENRRQLDDKEALVKELNMTHKLHEAEDAHVIAELRQRVAALEVHIQELVTTGQLNYNNDLYNGKGGGSNYGLNSIGASTDKLADFNDDMKYMLLMSSTASLLDNNNGSKFNFNARTKSVAETTPSTPSTPLPAKSSLLLKNGINGIASSKQTDVMTTSTSLISLPSSTAEATGHHHHKSSAENNNGDDNDHDEDKLNSSLDEKTRRKRSVGVGGQFVKKNAPFAALNRSQSSDETNVVASMRRGEAVTTTASHVIKEASDDNNNTSGEHSSSNIQIENNIGTSES